LKKNWITEEHKEDTKVKTIIKEPEPKKEEEVKEKKVKQDGRKEKLRKI
jgi:hypothetical protein